MSRLYDATTRLVTGALGLFAPFTAAKYQGKRDLLKAMRQRGYDAAQRTGANQLWVPQNRTGDSEIRVDNVRVLARARDLVRNNEYVAGAIQTFTANVVGEGITPQPVVTKSRGALDTGFNQTVLDLWEQWAEWSAFYEKQELICKHLVQDGEALAHFVVDETAPKGVPRFTIQLLECDQLNDTKGDCVIDANGNIIRRGIEFDKLWRPVAYHIWDYHPGDLLPLNYNYNSRRIPASEIAHPFRRDRISQTRGVSWLAPILMRMYDLGEYQDYEMIGAKLAAAFGVFVKSPFTDPYQTTGYPDTAANGDSKLEYIEPGRIERLLPGEEIQVADHQRPGQTYHPFVQTTLRGGASGIGMSYETFAGDYSQSTYSSARSALLEERRKYRKIQNLIVAKFNVPTWRKFIDYAALEGLLPIPAGAFTALPARFYAVNWEKPGWEWVDPLKDAQGAGKELGMGCNTRSRILAARGLDWRDVFQQLAEEDKLAKQLGIDITPADKREVVPGEMEGLTEPAGAATGGAVKQATQQTKSAA